MNRSPGDGPSVTPGLGESVRCPSCRSENRSDATRCAVCGAWLPRQSLPPIHRPRARPDVPIAIAFLVAGEFFTKVKSLTASLHVWDFLVGAMPALVYVAVFLPESFQDRFADPWLLRVLAIVIAGAVFAGAFFYLTCTAGQCHVAGPGPLPQQPIPHLTPVAGR